MQLQRYYMHPDVERMARISYKGAHKSVLPLPIRVKGCHPQGRICIYLNFRVNLATDVNILQYILDVLYVSVAQKRRKCVSKWKKRYILRSICKRNSCWGVTTSTKEIFVSSLHIFFSTTFRVWIRKHKQEKQTLSYETICDIIFRNIKI